MQSVALVDGGVLVEVLVGADAGGWSLFNVLLGRGRPGTVTGPGGWSFPTFDLSRFKVKFILLINV